MATLEGLLSTLSPDADLRGRQFERVAKWFLLNDPVQKAQFRAVWLWNEWPDADGPDIGIDLVAERKDRSLVAIQVKCYAAEYEVPKRGIDSFLSASSQERFAERLLIATCDLGRNARRTFETQQKPVHTLLRSDLDHSPVSWPASLTRLRPWKPKPHRPRPHQRRAIRDVIEGFEQSDRGQLIMACGTGKTLTSLWIAEALNAKRTLVLVPSLSLLAQTVREWKLSDARGFEFLAVCSDQTVVGEDAMVAHTADLPFTGVTTDPRRIAAFLRGRGPRVLFSTYQSSPRIAEAQALSRVPAFDLAIADEAHRCAGKVDAAFGSILNSEQIRTRRRLFATATPRIASGQLKRAAADYDLEISSMDDEAAFGKVLHRLTFGDAISHDLLSDYQVVVMFVDDEEVRDYVERGVFVQTDEGAVRDARTLAAQIGLAKAMRRFGLRRMVTFHSRVDLAARFAAGLPTVLDWMPTAERPVGKVWTAHVSGQMPSGQRDRLLRRLAAARGSGRAVLSNARCLTEGVDVPTLDGIVFVDPRRSQVDVVQAVGRAIRKAENKKIGTILLPVLLPPDADADEELAASVFEPVVKVLRALRDHDADLAYELDQLRVELGRLGTVSRLPAKIKIVAPTKVSTDFIRAFQVRAVELATPSWGFWFGLLQRFVEREGHARVPGVYRDTDGNQLGRWVIRQRVIHARGDLSEGRTASLAALPDWAWSEFDARWEEGFDAVRGFVERKGHARIPFSYRDEEDHWIGGWVNSQRGDYREGNLSAERIGRLESLPGWLWEPHSDSWEQGFVALERFAEREGHAGVPQQHAEGGFNLGAWVLNQRNRRDRMSTERIARLEATPGWAWAPRSDLWEQGFAALERFVEREGHAGVPRDHKEDRFGLGLWVSNQRRRRRDLSFKRVACLEALPGWTWVPKDDLWDQGFAVLERFVEREGHARVPQGFSDAEGYRLGIWVNGQRTAYRRHRLKAGRVARLEALPGWVWDPRSDLWEQGFAALERFVEREGHARVPARYRDVDGSYRLGGWVDAQRQGYRSGDLSEERIGRLEAVHLTWRWRSRDGEPRADTRKNPEP